MLVAFLFGWCHPDAWLQHLRDATHEHIHTPDGGVSAMVDLDDEDVPPRVLAAEELRRHRQRKEDDLGLNALIKVEDWHDGRGERPTPEEFALAEQELTDLDRALTPAWKRNRRDPPREP